MSSLAIANCIIGLQCRSLKGLDKMRFIVGGYEYRLKYEGGFAAFIAIYRREIGRRNFKYFSGIGGYPYYDAKSALEAILELIAKKG